MAVTADQLKEAITDQTREVEAMIERYRDRLNNEGDLKYLKWINALELVVESNEQTLNLDWDEVSPEDIQWHYNVLVSHQHHLQNAATTK